MTIPAAPRRTVARRGGCRAHILTCGSGPRSQPPGRLPLARTLFEATSESVATGVAAPDAARAEAPKGGGRGRSAPGFGYQPALDGIRAFAVAAVLLYHAGESWMVGGYLGVDAFFVLSGFLITSLLIAEWTGKRRIDLQGFWLRRARRLLPALFVVMAGIVAYTVLFAAPGEVDAIRSDSLAALGYVANWRFIFSGQSYFAQFTQPSPLKHMWSLAIEEQFYLVWPLIVCFLLWWRKSVRALLVACVLMIVGSAVLMAVLYHPGQDPSRVYYGTDTRAQSLLIGAVVGILLFVHGPIRTQRARVALRVAALVGAAYTIWLWSRMSERTDNLYRGGFLLAAIAVALVIVSVVQPDRGALGAVLSLSPLRWVGRISYGLYLWHWPVYLWLTGARTGLHGTELLALRLAVSVAFAATSYYLIELPIREKRLRLPKPRVVVPVAAVSLVVAVFAATTGGSESVADRTLRALSRANREKPVVVAPPTDPAGAAPAAAGAQPAAATPTKVLLVGDSVAGTLGLGFNQAGPANGLAFWNRGMLGCGLLSQGAVIEGGEVQPIDPGCDWRGRWDRDLQAFQPNVVVILVGAWDVPDRMVDGEVLRFGTVEYDTYFLHELDEATAAMGSTGAKVVLLTTPFFQHVERAGEEGRSWPEYDPWRVDRINTLFRQFEVAHPGRYTILDLNRYVSPGGKYADQIDGVTVRDDGVHFSQQGATFVANWLDPQIKQIADGTDPEPDENTVQYDPRHLRAR